METAWLKIHEQQLDNLPAHRRSQRNSRSNSRSVTPNGPQSPTTAPGSSNDKDRGNNQEETPAQVDQKAYDMKTALGQVAAGVAMGPGAGHGTKEGSWADDGKVGDRDEGKGKWSEGWKGGGGSEKEVSEGWKGEAQGEGIEAGRLRKAETE